MLCQLRYQRGRFRDAGPPGRTEAHEEDPDNGLALVARHAVLRHVESSSPHRHWPAGRRLRKLGLNRTASMGLGRPQGVRAIDKLADRARRRVVRARTARPAPHHVYSCDSVRTSLVQPRRIPPSSQTRSSSPLLHTHEINGFARPLLRSTGSPVHFSPSLLGLASAQNQRGRGTSPRTSAPCSNPGGGRRSPPGPPSQSLPLHPRLPSASSQRPRALQPRPPVARSSSVAPPHAPVVRYFAPKRVFAAEFFGAKPFSFSGGTPPRTRTHARRRRRRHNIGGTRGVGLQDRGRGRHARPCPRSQRQPGPRLARRHYWHNPSTPICSRCCIVAITKRASVVAGPVYAGLPAGGLARAAMADEAPGPPPAETGADPGAAGLAGGLPIIATPPPEPQRAASRPSSAVSDRPPSWPSSSPPPGMVEGRWLVRALYDFEAVNYNELTFRKDDVFVLLRMHPDDGWSEGEKDGQIGLFPSSYIRVLSRMVAVPVVRAEACRQPRPYAWPRLTPARSLARYPWARSHGGRTRWPRPRRTRMATRARRRAST